RAIEPRPGHDTAPQRDERNTKPGKGKGRRLGYGAELYDESRGVHRPEGVIRSALRAKHAGNQIAISSGRIEKDRSDKCVRTAVVFYVQQKVSKAGIIVERRLEVDDYIEHARVSGTSSIATRKREGAAMHLCVIRPEVVSEHIAESVR